MRRVPEDPQELFGHLGPLLVRGSAQHLELTAQVPDADPEDQAARFEVGPGPRHGGHMERVAVGSDEDVGAEADPPRAAQTPPARGQGLEEGRLEKVVPPVVRDGDVIGPPHRLVAQLLAGLNQLHDLAPRSIHGP